MTSIPGTNRWFSIAAIVVTAISVTLFSATAQEPAFQSFLPTFEQGITRFINGDAAPWKQNASKSDSATIMGAWGAYEKGWQEVNQRYDWAAARFQSSGAKVNVEYISSETSGNLAYTVSIERSQVLLVNQSTPATMVLRVTHIFRRENGQWKMVHRHADPLTAKTAPDTVLQK